MIRTIVSTAVLLVGLVAAATGPVRAGDDGTAIRHLLHASFDRPDAPLRVDPVVVAGDHGVAGWTQEDRGGRALLRRKPAGWVVVLCSGDGIRSADALRLAGVPAADAAVLADRLAAAERDLDPARLKPLASFEGTLMIEDGGAHPPHGISAHGPPAHGAASHGGAPHGQSHHGDSK